jgi:hypothetical protein
MNKRPYIIPQAQLERIKDLALFYPCSGEDYYDAIIIDCDLDSYPNAPSNAWFTSYNGSGEESHGHFILTCSDGGFLQIGETGYFPGSARIYVVKTNADGSKLWEKEFGSPGRNLGNAAIEFDDAYLICGALDDTSVLIKLDKDSGATLFTKSYELGGTNALEHLAVHSTGYFAIGYKNAEDRSNTFFTEGQGVLCKIAENGALIQTINLNEYLAQAYRIKRSDNDFLIAGLTEGAEAYALLKIDDQGLIQWAKTYGGSASDHCFGMDIGADGNIFLTGHTLSGTSNWDTYTMKIDDSGGLVWEVKRGNPRGYDPAFIHDEAWGVKATSDGGCLVVAGTGDEYGNYSSSCGAGADNSNIWHVYLIKYDADGNLEWQTTYSPADGGDWAGEDIDLAADGTPIIAVDNGQFGFLKLDSF